MIKEGSKIHLSIPVHKCKDLGTGILKKLIAKSWLTNEGYVDLLIISEIIALSSLTL
jgi:hypothetical protein